MSEDRGQRALAERLATWIGAGSDPDHHLYQAEELLGERGVYLPDGGDASAAYIAVTEAEIKRLRTIEAAAREYLAHNGSGVKAGTGDFDAILSFEALAALRAALADSEAGDVT